MILTRLILTAVHSKMLTVCITWRGGCQDALNWAAKYGDAETAHCEVTIRHPD